MATICDEPENNTTNRQTYTTPHKSLFIFHFRLIWLGSVCAAESIHIPSKAFLVSVHKIEYGGMVQCVRLHTFIGYAVCVHTIWAQQHLKICNGNKFTSIRAF